METKTEITQSETPREEQPARRVKSDQSSKLCELKVSYRRRASKARFAQIEQPILNMPEKCFEYLRQVWDKDTFELREEIVLICLDQSLAVKGWVRLFSGGFAECSLDFKLLFGIAVKTASSGIIVAHNHPSGNVSPSAEDRNITKRLANACGILGVRFVDHLITGSGGFYSFRNSEPDLFGN